MNRLLMAILALGLVLFTADLQAANTGLAAAQYWVAVDDLDEEGVDDDDGFSYLVSYQHWWDFLGIEVDMELLPDRFGETAYAPEAYILVGSTIYAGAGMGSSGTDGDFADDPVLCLQGRFESRNAAQCLRRFVRQLPIQRFGAVGG